MKKLSYILLALFIMTLSSCETYQLIVQEPSVSLNSVDVAGINFTGVNLLVHVDVENPNGFTIPLPRLDWEVFINSSSFVKGAVNNDKNLSSHQTVTLDLPLSVSYEGLYNSFASLVETKEAAYDIALKITFNIPVLGEKVYKLDFSGVLPIVKKPEISFKGITKKSLGTTMEFILTWEVENKNNFDFNLGVFDYDFSVNDTRWARGQVENPPRLTAGAKTTIPLTISVSAASIVRELVTIINRGSPVTYSCTGNMSLQGALPGLEKLELPLNLGGNTQIK